MRTLLLSASMLAALSAAAGAKDISGTAGNDLLMGTPEADYIEGLGGRDELFGFDGDDVLEGGDGNDEVFGGHGNDLIDGGPGDDFLDGREGDDALSGGSGRDAFVYYADAENGTDTITDFDPAEDMIALHDFAIAEVEIRMVGSDTVIDLPGSDRITLQGVDEFDPDGILYDVGQIVR